MSGPRFLLPDWPVPARVRGAVSTRAGGVSRAPFDSFNLADHVGDEPAAVAENRRRLREALELPAEPLWLRQVHGAAVAVPGSPEPAAADASVARGPGRVCAVLTADCLPVFLATRHGDAVGLAHAGWRGLAAGVIEATVAALGALPRDLVAWLGPAIGPEAFEVGPEVRETFVKADPASAADFRAGAGDRWHADLAGLARRHLLACGVTEVHGSGRCTHRERDLFFSYRRDGDTGRMASLAWLV